MHMYLWQCALTWQAQVKFLDLFGFSTQEFVWNVSQTGVDWYPRTPNIILIIHSFKDCCQSGRHPFLNWAKLFVDGAGLIDWSNRHLPTNDIGHARLAGVSPDLADATPCVRGMWARRNRRWLKWNVALTWNGEPNPTSREVKSKLESREW